MRKKCKTLVKELVFWGIVFVFLQPGGSWSEIAPAEVPVGRIDRIEKYTGRDYSIYVPRRYDSRKSWPLVVTVHGAGGTGKGTIGSWINRAEKRGFIVACPTCITAKSKWPGKGTYKEWFIKKAEKDMKVILGLIKETKKEYNIDTKAILLTGFSGGGYPTYYTGLRNPRIFTAIAPRSGNFWDKACDVRMSASLMRLPVYIVSGENDHKYILKAAPEAKEFLTKLGLRNMKYEVIPGMGHSDNAVSKVLDWFFEPYLEKKRSVLKKLVESAERALKQENVTSAIEKLSRIALSDESLGFREKALSKLVELRKAGDSTYQEGVRFLEEGNVKKAEGKFRSIAKVYAGLEIAKKAEAELHRILAQQLFRKAEEFEITEQYREAISGYHRVVSEHKETEYAKIANERIRAIEGNPEAMKQAKLKKVEEQANSTLQLADNLQTAQKYDLALKYYQEVIDKYPGTKCADEAKVRIKELSATHSDK